MTRTLSIVTATAIIGIAMGTYLLMRRKGNINTPRGSGVNRSHHLTHVFADAKKHISNIKTEEY